MITNRLCNPTPFLCDWQYDRGIHIKIEPDGFADLNAAQSEQFRNDVPGTESVRETMQMFGIFLRDLSVPYEVQAIKALKECIKFKDALYKDAERNLTNQAAAMGTYEPRAFEQTLESLGYKRLQKEVEKLKKRLTFYESKVDKNILQRPMHKQYDPKRTLLFLNPPKEFESEIAMEVFLEENPEIATKQKAWIAQFAKAAKAQEKEE